MNDRDTGRDSQYGQNVTGRGFGLGLGLIHPAMALLDRFALYLYLHVLLPHTCYGFELALVPSISLPVFARLYACNQATCTLLSMQRPEKRKLLDSKTGTEKPAIQLLDAPQSSLTGLLFLLV